MAGTRTTNTMAEGLMSILQSISVLKAAPDADLEAISGIEAQVLDIIKRPQRQAMEALASAGGVVPGMLGGEGGGMPPGGGMPGGEMGGMPPELMAAMGGMGGGMESPGGAPMGSPMPPMGGPEMTRGVRNGGSMPPVDELRRLIASEGLA
jgi:hypothetical protein